MQSRINIIFTTFANICELSILGFLALFQGVKTGMAVIQDWDWSKVFGPNGVAFVSVIACTVIWGTLMRSQSQSRKDADNRMKREDAREKREEERRDREEESRERRNKDLVEATSVHAEQLKALTVDCIKSQLEAAHQMKTHANNAQHLSINVYNLCEIIKKSPCLAIMKLRDSHELTLPKTEDTES